ncbi:MAG: discoidin domain-containing protein [Terriglobia bacterium]
MTKQSLRVLLLTTVLIAPVLYAQETKSEPSAAEIYKKIAAMMPKDSDFKFIAPRGWGENLMKSAAIQSVSKGESVEKAKLMIDGQPATTWASSNYKPAPVITIDLQTVAVFNRIVVFNRYTDMRGSGGGNNSVHELEIRVSLTGNREDMRVLKTLELVGPKEACIKKGAGQICFFIDNTEPQVFEMPETQARLVEIVPKTAFWGEAAQEEWKSSVAVSEVMLFNAPAK